MFISFNCINDVHACWNHVVCSHVARILSYYKFKGRMWQRFMSTQAMHSFAYTPTLPWTINMYPPILSPVGTTLKVTTLRSRSSFNHNLSISRIIWITSMSCRKSSPTLAKKSYCHYFHSNNLQKLIQSSTSFQKKFN